MKLIIYLILLFSSFLTQAQTVEKHLELNSAWGVDYNGNLIKNPSAYNNTAETTVSSASLSRDTQVENMIDKRASFFFNTSAQNGEVKFTLDAPSAEQTSGDCEFKGLFKGDASLYEAQIVDGSNNILSKATLTNEAGYRGFSINYPCAASGQRAVRIIQALAGTSAPINLGKLYYGQATNVGTGVPNNTFTAQISSTGVVSYENEDWISGNCTIVGAGVKNCPFKTGLFTVAPICLSNRIIQAQTVFMPNDTMATIGQTTTSGVYVIMSSATDGAVTNNLTCTRAGSDFIQPTITADQYDFEEKPFTPTGSWTGPVTYTGLYSRSGNTAKIKYKITMTGAPSGGSLIFNLPSGLSIDTSQLVSTAINASYISGFASIYAPGMAIFPAETTYVSTTTFKLTTNTMQGSYLGFGPDVSPTVPVVFASGYAVDVEINVPIQGWSTTQGAKQLVNTVMSKYAGVVRTEYLQTSNAGCTASPCTIFQQSGAFTSMTRSATGSYSLNYPSNTWSGTGPVCTCSAFRVTGSLGAPCLVGSASLNAVNIQTINPTTGALADSADTISIQCFGPALP